MSSTPISESNTTAAETPSSSSSSSSPSSSIKKNAVGADMSSSPTSSSSSSSSSSSGSPPVHPDFPDAKTLLISSKRPRGFLERTARELLAGGTDVIVLSALGDAIPLCVQLRSTLESKNAAELIKIETTYTPYGQKTYAPYTAGLRIYMKKHKLFKGSRISPGYVTFCSSSAEEGSQFTPVFDESPTERMGSVNAGDISLYVGGNGNNKAFGQILQGEGQVIDNYEKLHKALLTEAWKENESKETDADIRAFQLPDLEAVHSDLKLALCRPCKALKHITPSGTIGSVFVSLFKDNVMPYKKEKNMAMVYVVGPKGSDFPNKQSFLDAVESTALNLMTALCDYNGIARRQGPQKSFQRMMSCRVCLFSGGAYKHSDTSKRDVAKAILSGLEKGYRHGPAPRLNLAYDDDVFREVWTETTGLDVITHHGTSEDD